jgi:hypothetical protein
MQQLQLASTVRHAASRPGYLSHKCRPVNDGVRRTLTSDPQPSRLLWMNGIPRMSAQSPLVWSAVEMHRSTGRRKFIPSPTAGLAPGSPVCQLAADGDLKGTQTGIRLSTRRNSTRWMKRWAASACHSRMPMNSMPCATTSRWYAANWKKAGCRQARRLLEMTQHERCHVRPYPSSRRTISSSPRYSPNWISMISSGPSVQFRSRCTRVCFVPETTSDVSSWRLNLLV